MKKSFLLCALCMSLALTGCGKPKTPEQTATGENWNTEWTTVGKLLGVEVPDNYKEIRNEGVVTSSQTSYIVWAKGKPQNYTSDEGNEVTTYDAQIHLIMEESPSEAEATQDTTQWDAIAAERYTFTREWTADLAGQSFSLMEYEYPEDGGPHSIGASASGVHGCFAIHADVIALDGEDPAEILERFLSGLHYAE